MVVIVTAAVTGCSNPGGTYVVLNFERGAGTPSGIVKITLDLTLGNRTSTAEFSGKNGQAILLPMDGTLEIGSGEGDMTVKARALSADGKTLDTGFGQGKVTRAATTRLTVQFGKSPPDGGSGADGQYTDSNDATVMTVGDTRGDAGNDTRGDTGNDIGTDAGDAGSVINPDATSGDRSVDAPAMAKLALAPVTQFFGDVVTNTQSQDFTFTLTNNGDAESEPIATSVAPSGEFAISSDDCVGKRLTQKSSCTLNLKLVPQAAGLRAATLSVGSALGGTATASLTGTGLTPARLTVSPDPGNFGVVDTGGSSTVKFTVSNRGQGTTSALAVGLQGDSDFSTTAGNCQGTSLSGGGQCTLDVVFRPVAFGVKTTTLSVSAAMGGNPLLSLTGIGRDYVKLTVSKLGTGTGTVTANDLSCTGTTCSGLYPRTDASAYIKVNVSAMPDLYSTFTGWDNGGCSGTGGCTVTMDADKAVNATFTAKQITVTASSQSLSGHTGTVHSDDMKIDCGSICGPIPYSAAARNLTFSARPSIRGSTFIGWRGGSCKGASPTCVVPMTDNISVTATFGPRSYMFVTSTKRVPGRLAGVAGADTECTNLAEAARLPGVYKAWLSSSTALANARVGQGGWVRVDGRPFAPNLGDLIKPIYQVFYPPRIDEQGNEIADTFLVATGASGMGTSFGGGHCNDYTATNADVYVGLATSGSLSWSYNQLDSSGCGTPHRFYCFRTDLAVSGSIVPPTQPGRYVFVSSTPFIPGGGRDTADKDCRQDAQSAGLPNADTYVALLATNTESATKRLSLKGLPWKRTDEVFVVESAADLTVKGGRLIAPINMDAAAIRYMSGEIFTGSTDPALPGTDATTCKNWTSASAADTVREGYINAATPSDWFSYYTVNCDYANSRLYCLEP
jgi:hypothetical protein